MCQYINWANYGNAVYIRSISDNKQYSAWYYCNFSSVLSVNVDYIVVKNTSVSTKIPSVGDSLNFWAAITALWQILFGFSKLSTSYRNHCALISSIWVGGS
jgi:hypothetical protein